MGIAVETMIFQIERIQSSLFNEAKLLEQQYRAVRDRENKRASSDGRGFRSPEVKQERGLVTCTWGRVEMKDNGRPSVKRYTCPASGIYSVPKITAGSPRWEKEQIKEYELRFFEIRNLSRRLKEAGLHLKRLGKESDITKLFTEEIVIDGVEMYENEAAGAFVMGTINDLFCTTDGMLEVLFDWACEVQSRHYEEWQYNANAANVPVTALFPTIRRKGACIEIRWLKRIKSKSDKAIITTYKKGKNSKYDTSKFTRRLPSWAQSLVDQTEADMQKVRSTTTTVNKIRRICRDINRVAADYQLTAIAA